MKNILKITLVQTNLIWENIDLNLSHLSDLVMKADQDTDILVLPEMFSTGFTMDTNRLAEDNEGKAFRWMKNTASDLNFIITGSLIFSHDQKVYNRLIWMNPSGSYSYYDKRHLFTMGNENKHYSSGNIRTIIEFQGWRICPLICYDLRFPVWSRNTEDYHLLIYVANWPSSRNFAWNTLLRARAIENQCFVAGVNRVGLDGKSIEYIGSSMILDPKGYALAETTLDEEAVITAYLDMNLLNDFRKKFPVLNDADKFHLLP